MTAPIGRLQVGPGQTINSDWGNTVFDQSVQCFANNADRSTQWPAPLVGAVSYLLDTQLLYVRTPAGWQVVRSQAVDSYAEATGNSATNLGTNVWTNIMTATSVLVIGSGASIDASGIIISQSGQWEITITAAFATGTASRRGLGFGRAVGSAGDPPALNEFEVIGGATGALTLKYSDTHTFAAAARVVPRAFQDSGATIVVSDRRVTARRVF